MTATSSHAPGRLKEHKGDLYAGFAAGKGSKELAEKFGVSVSTIDYHRKQWDKIPKPSAEQEPAPVVDPAPAQTYTVAPPASPPAAEPQASTFEQAAAPGGDNPPATRDELEKLAAVMSGKEPRPGDTQRAPANGLAKLPAQPVALAAAPTPFKVEVGRIYEGSVARIDYNFVLIDLIELADTKGRSPRGKVALAAAGLPPMIRDLRDAKQFGLREGVLVNAQVVSVRPDPHRPGNKLIALSLDQAPGHPEGYTPPSHLPKVPAAKSDPKAEPTPEMMSVADTNALIKAEAEIRRLQERVKEVEEERQRLSADLTAAMATIEQASVATRPATLCATCIKADICPLMDLFDDEITPETQPGRLASVQILYGPRLVTRCSSYFKAGG